MLMATSKSFCGIVLYYGDNIILPSISLHVQTYAHDSVYLIQILA